MVPYKKRIRIRLAEIQKAHISLCFLLTSEEMYTVSKVGGRKIHSSESKVLILAAVELSLAAWAIGGLTNFLLFQACVISTILHLFLWIVMWLFLTVKQVS